MQCNSIPPSPYLEAAPRMQWDAGWAVLLSDAVTGVAVCGVVVAECAAQGRASLLKVGGAALTRVTAHAVLTAPRLQDGLAWDQFTVYHIHKQPEIVNT